MKTQDLTQLPHVVIIGAGFGGLRAASALAKAPVRVTLVDRNNYHLFQPLLYQVATASLSPDEIAQPVRAILGRQKNFDFRLAEVRGIDLDKRVLQTNDGPISYDTLILAAGSTTNFFGNASVERFGFGLKELEDAGAIRNHLLMLCEEAVHSPDPERRQALLTFVVAGGGPTGVESAGAISELVRNVLPQDFPSLDFSQARILLLEGADRLLAAMPEDLGRFTLTALKGKRVEVRFGAFVSGYDGRVVTLKDGDRISARTLIWAAGARAAQVVDSLPLEKGSQGRIKVLPTLQAPGHPELFVIGDAALLPDADGKPLPMLAPVAIQEGAQVGKNILAMLQGRPMQPFTFHDPGTMATIGRSQAVAQIGPLHIRGLFAWLAWVVVHIYQLIGFRNRMLVMIDWAWNYVVYDRPVRLINRQPDCVDPPARQPAD
jgi:NADH dehydrogenase